MAEIGLLGVGSGTLEAPWLGQQDSSGIIRPDEEGGSSATDNESRDERVLRTSVLELNAFLKQFSVSGNIGALGSLSTGSLTINTDAGMVDVGDFPIFVGASVWDARLVPVGCLPATSVDQFTFLLSNPSAGASSAITPTLYFLIHKELNT